MNRRLISLMLVLILVLTIAVPAVSAAGEGSLKKATVMIYMCGADLESKHHQGTSTLTDINRGSGMNRDEVNAVAVLGGSASWALGYDAKKLTYVELGGRRSAVTGEGPLAYMSEPQTLTDFIDATVENYPADDYYLVIWDHGGGPNLGMCHDFWSDETLSTTGLGQALSQTKLAASGKKLTGVLFNACLMDSFEVASVIAPYAEYMVATEESMYGMGYEWLGVLDSATPYEALCALVDDTYALNEGAYASQGDDVINTVSLVDLGKVEAVQTAMNDFFTAVTPGLDEVSFNAVSGQRRDSAAFGMGESGGNSCYDLVDLGSLVLNLREHAPAEADALLAALDEATPYVVTSDDTCYGMTVYHPFFNKASASRWMQVYNSLGGPDAYLDYIHQFAAILTGTPLADWTGLETGLPDANKDNRVLFSLTLTDEQAVHYGDSSLDVLRINDDGSYSFTYRSDKTSFDDGRLTGEYAGTALFAVSEGDTVSPPLYYELTSSGQYRLPAVVRHEATEDTEAFEVPALINLTPDPATKALTPGGVMIYDEASGGYTTIYNLSFEDVDSLSVTVDTRSETRDENGVLLPFTEWDVVSAETWSADADGGWSFALVNDVYATDQLYATFQVTDSQNYVYSSELKTVKPEIIIDEVIVTYDDLGMLLIDKATLAPMNGGAILSLALTNICENEAVITLDGLTVNGQALDVTAACYGNGDNWGLLKDEYQQLVLTIPASEIEGVEAVTDVTFDLNLRPTEDDEPFGTVPVTLRANLSL